MNGPTLVCHGCQKPTTLYKPLCDDCMRACGQEPRPEHELVAQENAARVAGGLAPVAIRLPLTEEQARLLQPHFEHVTKEWKGYRPGILAAQVLKSSITGETYMRVGFMPHERAKQFEHAVESEPASVQRT